jgi:hypothetical protein
VGRCSKQYFSSLLVQNNGLHQPYEPEKSDEILSETEILEKLKISSKELTARIESGYFTVKVECPIWPE